MRERVDPTDFETEYQRRRFRDGMGGEKKGSGFNLGGAGTTPTNNSGSSGQKKSDEKNQKSSPEEAKSPLKSEKNPNAKSATSKAVDKGLDQAAKKGSGTIAGEGANLVRAAKRAKDEGAGAGAQAAETAAAGIRAAAAATGYGGAVVKGYDTVKKALSVVGLKIKDRYVVYVLLFAVFLSFIPLIIFVLIIFFAWDNPRQLLSLGWTGVKLAGGFAVTSLISHGGASKLAYEVDVRPGQQAIAAPISGAPAPDTYEYKLAQIDWEKAKLQTLPVSNQCEVKTKKVKSTIDGSERSVIDTVRLKTNPSQELDGTARANCINAVYPIFNTLMRSQFIRDGLNRSLNVRYAYAEPVDSANLKKNPSELQKALREKTLRRIWNRGSAYQAGAVTQAAEVENMDQLVKDFFDGTRTVNKYTDTKYSQEIRDCANNFIPPNATPVDSPNDLADFYQKDIDKMANDLKCGIEPKDLKLYVSLPEESLVNSADPNIAIRPKRAALNVVCDLYSKLLSSDPNNKSSQGNVSAIDNYQRRVKDRINSAAAASWQAITYADTNRARFLNINELNKDFYKIAGMQGGQEYNYSLDGRAVGTPLEPDAISRITGYYNKVWADQQPSQTEQQYINGLNAIFDYVNKPAAGGISRCEAAQDKSRYGTPESDNLVNSFYTNAYPKFKQAIAGLDFYARPEKSQSISNIYNNLTAEDILFRMIRLESNTATAGTEDGPQNFNRMNFGMKAYMNAVSISLGGKFLNDNEAVARDATVKVANSYDLRERGLAYRLFSIDNPGSLTSRLRVAFTDRPQKIAGNMASMLGGVLNPIRNLAGEKGTVTTMLSGYPRVALAASVYDKQNLKLDPAGLPEDLTTRNQIENARFIENLKKSNNPDIINKFSQWDQCFKEFIPSRFHLLYPPAEKKDLYEKYCRPLMDIYDNQAGGDRRDPNSLESRYAAYHFANLQADALVYLSNPEKEDISLNAISSLQTQSNQTPSPAPAAPGGPPTASGQDTSAQQCPPGTSDAGVGEKYGVGRVLQYRIRLCNVQGITVNVSVAANLNNMLTAAKAAGVSLGGSGYRTFDRQVELRSVNGCPNTYTASSSSCRVPTARPGESNHESGEAVDFTQNGGTLRGGSSGFRWLSANARQYSFFNLPSESWHWSKDGK